MLELESPSVLGNLKTEFSFNKIYVHIHIYLHYIKYIEHMLWVPWRRKRVFQQYMYIYIIQIFNI